jgi:hypothetical protein
MGHYEVIDFLVVVFGSAVSGEQTLKAFYKRVRPFAAVFLALFGRERMPAHSTLSPFLASLPEEAVEALRSLFLKDLLARPLDKKGHKGGLVDRTGKERLVSDSDGTREAARQRALPRTADLPAPQRRLDELCAPGFTGRKRGEVVRTRTTILQAHTSQWFGSFANPGNGQCREELRRAVTVIQRYCQVHKMPEERVVIRLDGLYTTGAALDDLAGLPFVTRGKDYAVLKRPLVQSRLHLPADQQFTLPESDLVRTLYDCPDVTIGPTGLRCHVVVATHPARARKRRIGLTRKGLAYELFFSQLSQEAFTAADVVAWSLHRGAFEAVLADEDARSRSLVLSPCQWPADMANPLAMGCRTCVWNGVINSNQPRCAPPHLLPPPKTPKCDLFLQALAHRLWPPPGKQAVSRGRILPSSPMGRCPASQTLRVHERRKEANGSLRVVYAASIHSCRPCSLCEQGQWKGKATSKPRQVSVLLHPLVVGSSAILWQDWKCREHRRACRQLVRDQRVEVQLPQAMPPEPCRPVILSRAQRAHSRLSWEQRLRRNACRQAEGPITIQLFGVPDHFAAFLGLRTG